MRALGRVLNLLARGDQKNLDLQTLISEEIAASYIEEAESRTHIEGPSVLTAPTTQALGLALHELAINAMKHGAFAQSSGRLQVLWHEKVEAGKRRVQLSWIESGVDLSQGGSPVQRGYGSELIERVLPNQHQSIDENKFPLRQLLSLRSREDINTRNQSRGGY